MPCGGGIGVFVGGLLCSIHDLQLRDHITIFFTKDRCNGLLNRIACRPQEMGAVRIEIEADAFIPE